MRKKILVPVMALAMIVAAGVNYGMISSYTSNSNISLASFIKMSIAQAESVCGNCGKDYCPVCSGVGQFINAEMSYGCDGNCTPGSCSKCADYNDFEPAESVCDCGGEMVCCVWSQWYNCEASDQGCKSCGAL